MRCFRTKMCRLCEDTFHFLATSQYLCHDDIESVKGIIRSQREKEEVECCIRILYCAYKCCKYCVFKEHKVLFKVFFRNYFKSISILCAHHQPKMYLLQNNEKKGDQTKNIHLVML